MKTSIILAILVSACSDIPDVRPEILTTHCEGDMLVEYGEEYYTETQCRYGCEYEMCNEICDITECPALEDPIACEGDFLVKYKNVCYSRGTKYDCIKEVSTRWLGCPTTQKGQ